MSKQTTNIATVEIDGDGFVFVKVKNAVEVTAEEVAYTNSVVKSMVGEQLFCTLIDMRDISISHISKEAFSLHGENELTDQNLGEAIVVNSIGIRILANFYLNTIKPRAATKIFTDMEKAKLWLKEIKNQNSIFDKL